jgi:hypothetical protein
MAEWIVRPMAAGTDQEWGNGAGTSPTNVDPGDPLSHDDNSTYRTTGDPNKTDLFTTNWATKPGMEILTSVTSWIREFGEAAITYQHEQFDGSNTLQSPAVNHTAGAGPAYTNDDYEWPTAPDGTAWDQTGADFNATYEFGYNEIGDPLVTPSRITSVWEIVVYTPPAGTFSTFIAQWFIPVMVGLSQCMGAMSVDDVKLFFKKHMGHLDYRPSEHHEWEEVLEVWRQTQAETFLPPLALDAAEHV